MSFVGFSAAATVDAPDDWKVWRDASGQIQSIQATFVQTKHLPSLQQPLVSKGRFYFQAPDFLRWEYMEPIEVVTLVQGDRVKRLIKRDEVFAVDRGSAQETLRRIMKNMARWMRCEFENDPDFSVSYEKPNTIVLTPTRKVITRYIQSVQIERAKTPGVIRSVQIQEGKNTFTRIE